jgi:hypothetical protein
VLTIVEDQQHPPICESRRQLDRRRLDAWQKHVQSAGDDFWNDAGIGDGCQLQMATWMPAGGRLDGRYQLKREASLANPAGTDKRYQPVRGEQVMQIRQLGLAPYETGKLTRHVAGGLGRFV